MSFVLTPGAVGGDPDLIRQRQMVADAMMSQGLNTSPVRSWTQGAARLADALVGGLAYRKMANEAQQGHQQMATGLQDAANAILGGTPASPASAMPSPSGIPQVSSDTTSMPSNMTAFQNAIASNESAGSGGYSAVGPTTKSGDRAYGKYQVMGANIPQWTQDALGTSMTPDQFLANPQAQDAVFNHQFGKYLAQTGNPQDAASMWFSGRPLAQAADASDVLGTTDAGYVNKFTSNLQQPSGAAQALASEASGAQTAPDGASDRLPPAPVNGPVSQSLSDADFNSRFGKGPIQLPQSPSAPSSPADVAFANTAGQAAPQQAIAQAIAGAPSSQLPDAQALSLLGASPAGNNAGNFPTAPSQAVASAMSGNSANPAAQKAAAVSKLLTLAGNPWATEGQRSIINALIQRETAPGSYGFQTLPDGTVVRTNNRTGAWEPIATAVKPQFTQIGTDAWGTPEYGFVDAAHHQVFGLNGQPVTGTGNAPSSLANGGTGVGAANGLPVGANGPTYPGTGPSEPTGDEFLQKNVPPELQQTVKKLANYQLDPRTLSYRGNMRSKLVAWAAQFDPNYDAAQYPARAAAIKEFNSGGPSSPAGQIVAGNTAIQHAGKLFDLSDQIGGVNNAGPLNVVANYGHKMWEGATQDPNASAYNAALSKFVEEATKFYRGTGGNEADLQRDLSSLSIANSPASRQSALKELIGLMSSKINSLQDRWKTAMGPTGWQQQVGNLGPDFPIIQKDAQGVIDKMGGLGDGTDVSSQGSASPVPSGATATNPKTGEKVQWNGKNWVPMQ